MGFSYRQIPGDQYDCQYLSFCETGKLLKSKFIFNITSLFRLQIGVEVG